MGATGNACRRRRRVEKYWYKDQGRRPRNSKGRYLFEMGKAVETFWGSSEAKCPKSLEMPGETSVTKSPKDPKKGETQRKRAELNRHVN